MTAAPQIIRLPEPRHSGSPPGSRYRRRQPRPHEESKLSRDRWSLAKPIKGNFFRTLIRLVEVVAVGCLFAIQVGLDIINPFFQNPRQRTRRRAQHVKRVFERLGGAFIKVGQQLSLRRDMLAAEYCEALGDLLDNVKGFDFAEAKKAIEEEIGRPVETVFSDLDPNPIGRASIACVYRAWLRDEYEAVPVQVAIKVRRPGIVKLVAADLRALDWVMFVLEFFTIFRQGVSRRFRAQTKEILFDELDFIKEARYQEIFHRRYRKHKKYGVSTPKVFHQYSGRTVLVSEFVDAIPLESVTNAVEFGDLEYLAYLRSLDIDVVRLAKRLIRYSYHSFFEDTFFHGDPHPANIMVLPNNKLVFVDFGACGTFSKRDRNLMLQMHYFHSQKDIRGMVECVIGLMEPLPPMDVDEFRSKLEKQYWDGYYGLQSRHSDWRDRTSYRLWIALFDLVREYQIPMPLNVLRMIRATLLYDTVAAQLYNQIDVFKEFRKYEKDFGRRVRAKLIGDFVRQALCGPDLKWWVSFKRLLNLGRTTLLRLQKFIDEPPLIPLQAMADKIFFAISRVTQWAVSIALVTAVFVVGWGWNFWATLHPSHCCKWADEHPIVMAIYGAMVGILTLVHANAIRIRFLDPDNY